MVSEKKNLQIPLVPFEKLLTLWRSRGKQGNFKKKMSFCLIKLDLYKVLPAIAKKRKKRLALNEMCRTKKEYYSYHIDGLYWIGLEYKSLLLSGALLFCFVF